MRFPVIVAAAVLFMVLLLSLNLPFISGTKPLLRSRNEVLPLRGRGRGAI